ncbi:NAD(P)-binding protein [Daldinia caldariorum]|uniref:NAD(P)-binding protein n=1 Tax=Daldinia caldariorum TaxID=326644 RepID=UPI002007C740|nr:NAD(P)-binding protein [Daldinia caldariorum]KAI1468305.1 NAD(P)-binding protein [Daldinia caldariorum]
MSPKTVFITGCGPGGIGSALATEFHLRGHRVIASSEDPPTHLEAVGIETLVLDVTSQESIAGAVSHVSKLTGGTLDVLVNNAGVLHIMPFAHADVAAARRVLDVNVMGVFAVTQGFLPLLVAGAAAAQKNGDGKETALVANIGSVNAEVRPSFFGIYNASKAAVDALGGTIRPELAPLGIRVVTVKTGAVGTGLFASTPVARLPEGSPYEPIREFIESRKMLQRISYLDPETYAKQVVGELLKRSVKPLVWCGPMSTLAWILTWFGWEGMTDIIYIRGNELHKCAIKP